MGRIAALGLIALISSVAAAPLQFVSLPSESCQNLCPPPPSESCLQSADPCSCYQQESDPCGPQATPCGDGSMTVTQIQRSLTPHELEQIGFQSYPTPSGILFVKPSPDALIQPPSILVQIPPQQPVVPPPFTVQPPALQPITPPAVYTRPPQPSPIQPPAIQVRVPTPAPITPPPICVKVPPLPSIQPPPISVKPPTPAPICPPPITVRQPCIGPIQPPSICIPTYEFLRGQGSVASCNPSPCPCPPPCPPPCNSYPPCY